MKKQVFAIYDTAVGAYLQPFFMRSPNEAIRSFRESANMDDHPFNKNPEDYTLFHLGEYDEETGKFQNQEARSYGKAMDHLEDFHREADTLTSVS